MTSFNSQEISKIHHDLDDHLPSEPALRAKALESLLVEKGLVDPEAMDAWVEMYREEIGPKRGARVVARAWKDPAFKARLLANATSAIDELGFGPREGSSRRRREYCRRSQPRRLHALLMLSVFHSGHVARMVQVQRIQSARRTRSSGSSERIRRRTRRHHRGAGLGHLIASPACMLRHSVASRRCPGNPNVRSQKTSKRKGG